jgi:isopentenyl-diphosphate Delta-isomerase
MVNDDFLILVDSEDIVLGKMEKSIVHQKGILHRAFSVFIFNSKGQMLIQQRANEKYHSGGLWTNACCSHPRFGENLNDAVKRRLYEEIGLHCSTTFAFSFQYKAEFENGLIENEFDHVYIGVSDDQPVPDFSEVKDWKYEEVSSIQQNLKENPSEYTVWFRLCFEQVLKHYKTMELKC